MNIWLIGGGAVMLVYWGFVVAITRRLKQHHTETWNQLGQFTIFVNNSMGSGFKFLRYFVFTSRYRELGDERLNRLALGARILFAIFAMGFAAVAVLPFMK